MGVEEFRELYERKRGEVCTILLGGKSYSDPVLTTSLRTPIVAVRQVADLANGGYQTGAPESCRCEHGASVQLAGELKLRFGGAKIWRF